MDGAGVTDSGNEFHARAAATENARLPIVARRVAGTMSAGDDDDRRHVQFTHGLSSVLG